MEMGVLCFNLLMIMDKVFFWNVRDFNDFNKQRQISFFGRENKIYLYGFMEIKIIKKDYVSGIQSSMFFGWNVYMNYVSYYNGIMGFKLDDS